MPCKRCDVKRQRTAQVLGVVKLALRDLNESVARLQKVRDGAEGEGRSDSDGSLAWLDESALIRN